MALTDLPLVPFRGYRSSSPRHEVGGSQFVTGSLDWLFRRGMLVRRKGSAIFGDTLSGGDEVTGILPADWDALARRMYSVRLPSLEDGYPAPLGLFTNEDRGFAQAAWRSTNGTDAWRTIGAEFSDTHYPAASAPNFRVVPLVYENEYGGITLHRLNTERDRRAVFGGSRNLMESGREIVAPCYTATPCRWNRRFNDSSSTGSEPVEVYPLGLIPPLGMPKAVVGTDLGEGEAAADRGPWKGSDAFFYTCCFENEAGELSMFCLPRPHDSAWADYPGYGYVHLDPDNPDNYFSSVVISNIPVGPPGTRWVHILRTNKVDVESDDTFANFPAINTLQFAGRVANGVTDYIDTNGNDLSLTPDPRIQEMFRSGLMWPYRARTIGAFDGRFTLGCLRPNPAAIVLAPWLAGAVNFRIDDADWWTNFGDQSFFYALTPTSLVLRRSAAIGGDPEAEYVWTGETYNGSPIIGVDDIDSLTVGLAVTGLHIPDDAVIESLTKETETGVTTTNGSVTVTVSDSSVYRVGQGIQGPTIQADTVVAGKPDGTHITLSKVAFAPTGTTSIRRHQVTLTEDADTSDTGVEFTAAAEAETPADLSTSFTLADYTLRELVDIINTAKTATSVTHACSWDTWDAVAKRLECSDSLADLSVGMVVRGTGIQYGTRVTQLDDDNNFIYIDKIPGDRASDGVVTLTFEVLTASTGGSTGDWAAQVVPGADADAEATNLLRTLVADETATWLVGSLSLVLDSPDNAAYITPGMLVTDSLSSFAEGTVVAAVDADTGIITLSAEPLMTNTGSVTFAYDTGDSELAGGYGYVRAFGNCLPGILYWSKDYLDDFQPEREASAFSTGSPGYAQDAANTWMVKNKRSGPAGMGPLVGMADMGPHELHFHTRGRMLLTNTRTGESHVDEDYTLSTVSWTRGARSPYLLCAGNGWAFFVNDDGLFACSAGQGEVLISGDIYRAQNRVGEKGDLEYAIAASIAASEGDTDAYRIHGDVHDSVLYVRYWSSASAGRPDRELRYDFSESVGRSGLAEVLQADGSPFPWSCPLTVAPSCSAMVGKSDGMHLYGARDSNAGTGNGRVDEYDTGTEDNGVAVTPVGYTGMATDPGGRKMVPQYVQFVGRKSETGLKVAVATDPETAPGECEWLDTLLPASGSGDYIRALLDFPARARHDRSAMAFRITDDGAGDCPEVLRLTPFVEPQDFK